MDILDYLAPSLQNDKKSIYVRYAYQFNAYVHVVLIIIEIRSCMTHIYMNPLPTRLRVRIPRTTAERQTTGIKP